MKKGYIYDVCSWGITVHYEDGEVMELVVNDFGTWDDIYDWVHMHEDTIDFGEYKNMFK